MLETNARTRVVKRQLAKLNLINLEEDGAKNSVTA